jgi:hypothetical protein
MSEQELELWRNAGELYGRIKKRLGFGSCSLSDDFGPMPGGFVFNWSFNHRGERYERNFFIGNVELVTCFSLEAMANAVGDRLKNEARHYIGVEITSHVDSIGR